jgi:APA family basic amino acid/polyamine antiporter
VPLVFVLGSSWLVVNTLLERPIESLAGLLLMAAGVPAYVYWRRQKIRVGIEGDRHP